MSDKPARVDWRGADLRGVNMAGMNMEGADMRADRYVGSELHGHQFPVC